MKHLVQAAKEILGTSRFEEWLDNHSDKLNLEVNSITEAKNEIYKALRLIQRENEDQD